jgi:hypothetical protein
MPKRLARSTLLALSMMADIASCEWAEVAAAMNGMLSRKKGDIFSW